MSKTNETQVDYYYDDPTDSYSAQGRFPNKTFSFIAVAALLVVGSTFAANIGLNSGQRVEFGQGVSISTSCDKEVILTPKSRFVNSTGNGAFYFSGFTVSSIDATACNGVSFSLSAYGDSSSTPITLFDTQTSAIVNDSSTAFVVAAGQSGFSITDTSTVGSFSAAFSSPLALTNSIYKITLQTNNFAGGAVAVRTYNASFDPSPYYQTTGLGGYAVIHPDGYVCGVIVASSSGTMSDAFMGCPAGASYVLQTKPSPTGNVAGYHGANILYSAGVFTISGGTTIYRGVATDTDGRIWDTGSGLTLNLA